MKLTIVLEKQDEGGYTAYVPSLPGCVSQGETREEALKNIKEASIRERIQVFRLLTPGDFESVRNFLRRRYSFVFGGRSDVKRLELGGIKVNQFLPLKSNSLFGSRGLLYDEIERLEHSHRAFVTSA